jgi:hypothetical protein
MDYLRQMKFNRKSKPLIILVFSQGSNKKMILKTEN